MQRDFKISLSPAFYSDVVALSQYDDKYNVIFHVRNHYASVTVTGMTAKFNGTRNDGLGFSFNGTGQSDYFTFAVDTSLTAVAGTHVGEVVIYDQNGLYFGSANVKIVIEPSPHPDSTIDADVEEQRTLAEEIHGYAQTATQAKTDAEAARDRAESARDAAETAQEAAEDAQDAAETSADRAEQAAQNAGYMFFYIDEDGDLIYQRTENVDVDFYLDNGDLFVRATE